MQEREIEDLDSSLKLLEEYTARTNTLCSEIVKHRRQRISFIFILGATLSAVAFIVLSFNDYLMKKSELSYILILGLFTMSFSTLALFYFFRKPYYEYSKKNHLFVSTRQLRELVVLISQFTEHNRNLLTEFKRFELNLRLIGAEESIEMAKRLIDLKELDKYYPKNY